MRRRRTLSVSTLGAVALLFMTVAAMGAGSEHQPQTQPQTGALTSVREIRNLSQDQARQGRSVRLRGVVTVLSGWKSSFFFQDGTSGISVDRAGDLPDSPELKPGQMVEVRGVTGAGLFAPVVVATGVTVLGEGKKPAARLFGFEELAGGSQDSRWIAIRGTVRSAAVKPSWGRPVLFLEVDTGAGNPITVRVHDFAGEDWRRLPSATVLIRGVCATNFNDKRQFIGLRLFVADLGDVQVLRSGPADPFNRPLRPLVSLLQFHPSRGDAAPVRVRGIVTYFNPEHGVYLQDGSNGILVHGADNAPAPRGAEVEAVGYPGGNGYSPSLESAIYRVIDATPRPIASVPVAPSHVLSQSDGFFSSPYDSLPIRIQGKLIEAVPGTEEYVLVLRDKDTAFTARLPKSVGRSAIPTPGAWLELTGICFTRVDENREPRSFWLLLGSASDIAVLKGAPWWNAAHATAVAGALLLATALLAGWLGLVRREAGLRLLTLTDPLTGLYNRRGFLLLAEHQWQLALRKNASLLIFYIDLDEFKEINDSLGHKTGDQALQAVAAALRECFRKTDLIGRLGGDEFAVTAVDALPQSREQLERRLEAILEQANRKQGRPFALRLSIGILSGDASLRECTIEDLLARADALMYEQKAARKPHGRKSMPAATPEFVSR